MKKTTRGTLAICALLLAAAIALAMHSAQTQPAADAAVKIAAAERMQRCMDAIKQEKQLRGIEIAPEDLHDTGMIGEPYSAITTTLGSLEAKRASADANMAALMVQLLHEAGVQKGDTVAAGFSGSFPAMNLAVLSACAEMDVNAVVISSVGASTYGANQEMMTFPDMLCLLTEQGLLPRNSAAFSLGGQDDCGTEMDKAVRDEICTRLESKKIPLIFEPDYQKNLEKREALYASYGTIRCFVGVGGNLTTLGRGAETASWGIFPPYTFAYSDENSGLIQRYNSAGVPAILVLNLKRLTAEYGVPFDVEEIAAIGEGTIYQSKRYRAAIPAVGIAGTLLLLGKQRKRKCAHDD